MGGPKMGEKAEKKILNPQEKLAAINRVNERGESKASVARDLGIPESTLRGWCKNSLRINYRSNLSSPDTDDALKLSPTHSHKRKSLISSDYPKKRGRRPASPNSALLMTTSTLTELNRLKSEYGLSKTGDYYTPTTSSAVDTGTSSLDAAMRGWALQMQMLLQASMATSTSSDPNPIINPITTQGNIPSSSLLSTSTANSLWAPLLDSANLYSSTITTPSTSSTLPLNLNFPTTSSTNISNSLLMSYLPNTLVDTANIALNANSAIPSSLNTSNFQAPWKATSPTGFPQNLGSSASSSGSVSPKSRGSINSQSFNELYYGTDEDTPALTNLSHSNEEETSSDSLPVHPPTGQTPMDFSTQSQQVNQNTASVNEDQKTGENEKSISEEASKIGGVSENNDKLPLMELPIATGIESKDEGNENEGETTAQSVVKPESCVDGHRKKLESVLATVFQVTNNNTIVSLDEEQKSISISEAIECGEVFLKFLETAKDPNVTASQITQFRHILSNIKAGCAQKSSEKKRKVSRK